ncbi:MAG TPA: nucleotidyltransferase domain-containing protein [Bacteroidales bacterium]|nr:nucleotidyltransferase domain-containing protein [Bacteroidales bacterium]
MNTIDYNIDQIKELCSRHGVSRLFVFGSVLTDRFEENSDIDFLVDFKGVDLYNYADNYFGLKDALEKLLNRQIDLLEEKALKNPYLKKSIDSSKKLIYE